MTRRRGHDAAFALLASLGVTAAAVAPAQAASGVFLYTDTATGRPTWLVDPPDMECIAAKGSGAHNLTRSDVILYHDGACNNYLLVLVPGESLNMPFSSLGFVPSGGRPAPPAQASLPS